MKRNRVTVAMLALAVSLMGLGGCSMGPTADELIREDVASELDLIATDLASSTDVIAANMGQELDTLGVDPKAFAEAYTEGYAYTIDAVHVDEEAGTATAAVSMTCKPMRSILEEFQVSFTDAVNGLDLNSVTQEDLYKLGGEMLLDTVKAVSPETRSLDLAYSKGEDGEWRADDSAATELMDALMG